MKRVCKFCGEEFETTDGRRKVCDKCKKKYTMAEYRAKMASEYVKQRRKTDVEYRNKRYQLSNNYRLDVKHKEFKKRAVELTAFGHDIEALTKYLEDNFQLRHK